MNLRSAAILSLLIPASAGSQPHNALDKALAAYEQAQIHGDGPALNALLADDYLLVNGGGGREDKKTFIADLTDPEFKLQPYSIDHPVLRRWQSGAVSAGIARETGSDHGKPFEACIRFADTWKLTGGKWQVVFTQVARMASPGPAGCGM